MIDDIQKMIDKETLAWDTGDISMLLSIFHQDMVWVWPKDANSHNPVDWETPQGKFNYKRWYKIYSDMFANFTLKHNRRNTVKITETSEQDGGFAVVDIDTAWENKLTGQIMRWAGRTCKTYVKTSDGYKMIFQTGVLIYE